MQSKTAIMNHLGMLSLLLLPQFISALTLPGPKPDQATWTTLAPISIAPRQEHSTVATDADSLYIVGGVIPDPTVRAITVPTVQKYSLSNNTWSSAAPLPRALNHPNVAAVGGKIYVLGGLAADIEEGVWLGVGDSWVYCPQRDAWTKLPSMPADQVRGSAGVGVHGSKIYLAGGLKELNLITTLQDTVDTVSVFDTRTGAWERLPERATKLPEGRDHAGAAAIGDAFYIIGGRNRGQVNVRDTVFKLDLRNIQRGWTTGPARMPTPRGGLATGVVGRKIYTFGGEGNTAVSTGVFNETEVYDTVTEKWTRLPQMKLPRHGTYAVAIGKKVYIPGGGIVQSAAPVDTFDVFEP